MHEIYELKEMLCEELEKYGAKGDLSAGELEIVDKLAHTVKNLCKIIESYEDKEYSGEMGDMMSYQRGNQGGSNRGGSYRGSYRGGSYGSYARNGRGRGSNARRDSMGRYSSERGYSRADSVDEMVDSIRGMMGELPQEIQRDAQKFVQKLEQLM